MIFNEFYGKILQILLQTVSIDIFLPSDADRFLLLFASSDALYSYRPDFRGGWGGFPPSISPRPPMIFTIWISKIVL